MSDHKFGARFRHGVGTEFALWAPDHRRVELLLLPPAGEPWRLNMVPQADGFFALTVADAVPGWRYQYIVDGEGPYPDPASRRQANDVHDPSEIVDPEFHWSDQEWRAPLWSSAVIYELHVGTFTPEGSFLGVISRLDHLCDLGVSAIELMPVADFPGERNWGYDGTFLFAPDAAYGRPEELKQLVDACHSRGVAVILDVVYNHFGPDGNYMWPICRHFFDTGLRTPWGAAINIAHPVVRDFFCENARFWIDEYHFDGLRFDAVQALDENHRSLFLSEVRKAARAAAPDRSLFLVLENPANQSEFLRDSGDGAFDAQWNDDFHHALHSLVTNEQHGIFQDYPIPEASLERILRHGFSQQGEYSDYRRCNVGTPTDGINLDHFVNYIQSHDMVGNRALGERLHQLTGWETYRTIVAFHLFLPGITMLFMGDEFCAATPFLFFTDHNRELGERVRKGRIGQHSSNPEWRDRANWGRIPHPQKQSTFLASKIDWDDVDRNRHVFDLYKQLLSLRAKFLPLLDRRQESISVQREGRLFCMTLRDHRGREVIACIANFEAIEHRLPDRFHPDRWQQIFATEPSSTAGVPPISCQWLRQGKKGTHLFSQFEEKINASPFLP
ncbi:MAG: malto-oligosyltrehalose trehalohydrolase [Chromatiaceae bacterium]|nr:malto-oligosyltrehalose trehalohydrolase [Chromatiaceae bacterium]